MIGALDLRFINRFVHGVDTHVHEEREEGRDLRGRTVAIARALRRTAAQSAAVCADCFRPLAPDAAVTMTTRNVWSEAEPRWLYVPICLICTRRAIERQEARRGRAVYRPPTWRWTRCLKCRRPIRIYYAAGLAAQTCCADCERRARYDRNNLRRRVFHRRIACPVCWRTFVPTRSDARTCSARCRAALHRQRRRRRNG
jgi:predicted nucleic acid-binding Zn ribbon protein